MTRFIPYQYGHPVVNVVDSGYQRVAQDIDISASKDAYFPFLYKGRLYYFDISRFSPGSRPEEEEIDEHGIMAQKDIKFSKNIQ